MDKKIKALPFYNFPNKYSAAYREKALRELRERKSFLTSRIEKLEKLQTLTEKKIECISTYEMLMEIDLRNTSKKR